MKKIILLISLISITNISRANDVLYFEGKKIKFEVDLYSLTRQSTDSIHNRIFDKQAKVQNCKNYYTEWLIDENELYIKDILLLCNEDTIELDLCRVFEHKYCNGRVKADWVSGTFTAFEGRCLYDKWGKIYEVETTLNIKNGKLINHNVSSDNYVHHSIYSENTDSLDRFISQNINTTLIPNYNDTIIRIVAFIKTGKLPRPDNVEIVYNYRYYGSLENSNILKNDYGERKILENEITRVILQLPDWDIYIRKGEVVQMNLSKVFYFQNGKVIQN